jgi:hypothetical protein
MTKETQEALDRTRARFADTTQIEVSLGMIDLLIHQMAVDFMEAIKDEADKKKKPATKAWNSFLAMDTEAQYRVVVQGALKQFIDSRIQRDFPSHE